MSKKGLHRSRQALAAVAACVVASGGAAGVASAAPEGPPPVPTAVVSAYADQYGVGTGEAKAALAEQRKADGLTEQLRDRLGASFSQLWFREGRHVVYVTDDQAAAAARELIGARELSDATEIRVVPWTAGDLDRALRTVARGLADERGSGDAQVALVEGGIEVRVGADVDAGARADASDAAARATAATEVPVSVRGSSGALRAAQPDYALPGYRTSASEPLIGGMLYFNAARSCSTGFYATAGGGVYFLTAGHCMAAAGTPEQSCTVGVSCPVVMHDVGGFVNSGGDVGVLASAYVWGPWPAFLDWTNPSQTAGVHGVAGSVGGYFYCKTGAGSPGVGYPASTCGTNRGVSAVVYRGYPGITLYLQTLEGSGLCSAGGDSGGPYWHPATANAIGIHSGSISGCGTGIATYYTDVGPAAATLGVSVATL